MSRWTIAFLLAFAVVDAQRGVAQSAPPLDTHGLQPSDAPHGILRPEDGATLGGRIDVDRLLVPAGATVWVESDLELVGRGDLVIDGALRARPGLHGPNREGIALHLHTSGAIIVRGQLLAGDGADGAAPGEAGGRGGSLRLEAPLVVASTDLVAGQGGRGGLGAAGGDGGDILITGLALAPSDWLGERPALRAGQGGMGGAGLTGEVGGPGGRGGAGGSASAPTIPTADDGLPGSHGGSGNDDIKTQPGAKGGAGGPCSAGLIGGGGLHALAGGGGAGGPGGSATSPVGSGGAGGDGGDGGVAVASGGGFGGNAGDCCFLPLPGQHGGPGGDGGHAFGGKGGSGGMGGQGGLLGVGGDGGAAGPGGGGFGGYGGIGGNGGGGDPPGIPGPPGTEGVGVGGTAGLVGPAGFGGLGPGITGASAVDGEDVAGHVGLPGDPGAFCLEFATWTQTGFALAGTDGIKPVLFGVGPLTPSSSNTLGIFNARPNAPGVLFASLSPLLVPFKGGWLIPAPDVALFITAGPTGGLPINFFMPPGALLPVAIVQLQCWFVDDGSVAGLSATNGLRARVP